MDSMSLVRSPQFSGVIGNLRATTNFRNKPLLKELEMSGIDFNRFELAFEAGALKNRRNGAGFVAQLMSREAGSADKVRSLLDSDSPQLGALEASCNDRRLASTASLEFLERRSPAIPGYIIQRHIGAGGQADVFLARQASTGQDVAIKVFRGSRLAESQHRRIDAETEALVRLQLPNVVAILDRGQTACGGEYLVTRFVDGLPIDKAARQLLESPQKLAALFTNVAETLARVHRHGILHRDLKPSNILVDRNGEPYVLDFGLASFFADPSGRLLTVTPNEAFQGSILWASPEQVDSSFGAIDQRSDIYSLGVVLYQSLTGRFPYPVDGGFLDVAQHIVRSAPARLTAHEFEAVVLRALEKQPKSRFQSADEFAAALRRVSKERVDESSEFRKPTHNSLWSRFAPLAILAVICGILWSALHAEMLTAPNENKSASSHTAQVPVEVRRAQVTRIDDELSAFGVVPPQWTQVGSLQATRHEIERANISIEVDFVLRLYASADRASRASFVITLVGANGGDDLTIVGEKVNTWSDNESWQFRTPAGTLMKGLPVGSHTFELKRVGALLTFAVDSVHLPQRNDTLLATFAANGSQGFKAIRLMTTGPAIRLERLRLSPVESAL
jgi:serine/threonine-protein kinase